MKRHDRADMAAPGNGATDCAGRSIRAADASRDAHGRRSGLPVQRP